jgi:hypothetical protein
VQNKIWHQFDILYRKIIEIKNKISIILTKNKVLNFIERKCYKLRNIILSKSSKSRTPNRFFTLFTKLYFKLGRFKQTIYLQCLLYQ